MTTDVQNKNYRSTAVIVGILFIIATVFLFIGEAIYGPALSTPDYLETAFPNRTTAVIGMLLEFLCVLSIPLIPVFLFPVLRKISVTAAIGYIVFRFFEAILFVLTEINELSLISVSQLYLENGGTDLTTYQNMSAPFQFWNDWSFGFYLLVFAVGGLIFYSTLYKTKMVPRFISGWGLISDVLMIAAAILSMIEVDFGLGPVLFQLIFVAPIAIQEMVLAVWFIVKGLDLSAVPQN